MKYVFLFVFVLVALGSFLYYGNTRESQGKELQEALSQLDEPIILLVDKASEIEKDSEKLGDEFGKILAEHTARHDAFCKQITTGMNAMTDSLPALPQEAADADKASYQNMVQQITKLGQDIEGEERHHAVLKQSLRQKIADNTSKIEQEKGGVKHSQEPVSMDERLKAIAERVKNPSHQLNNELLDSLLSNCSKYEANVYASYEKAVDLRGKIAVMAEKYEVPLNAAKERVMLDSATAVKNGFEELKGINKEGMAQLKEIAKEWSLNQAKIQSSENKAKKLNEERAAKALKLEKDSETKLSFIKAILTGVSVILAVSTLFVFIGSKKVKEVPHTDYRA